MVKFDKKSENVFSINFGKNFDFGNECIQVFLAHKKAEEKSLLAGFSPTFFWNLIYQEDSVSVGSSSIQPPH